MPTSDLVLAPGGQQPPFLYEIRVKGRLSGEQWADWYDDLSVTATGGESVLHGRAEDHAALYGLLGRLRDLAIPLVAVKVLDADAQRRMAQETRRLDLAMTGMLVALYLLLLGGLVTVTVFVAPVINPALALMLLFAALGGLAFGFSAWTNQVLWRWLAYFLFAATLIAFLVFIPVSGLLPPPLGIGITLFLLAAGVVYGLDLLRRRRDDIRSRLTQSATGTGPD